MLLAIYYLLVINRFLKPSRISPYLFQRICPTHVYTRTAYILNKEPFSHIVHREILQLRVHVRWRTDDENLGSYLRQRWATFLRVNSNEEIIFKHVRATYYHFKKRYSRIETLFSLNTVLCACQCFFQEF